jgi:hypothetical protein
MSPVARSAWLAAALAAVVTPAARAQPPTRVALSGVTPAPGTGAFTGFDHAPAIDGGAVAFRGLYTGGEGVYTWNGGTPALIANSATPSPTGGLFAVFGPPAVSGTIVAFAGGQAVGVPFPFRGVYAAPAAGGSITAVADTTTLSPSNGSLFAGFFPPAVSGATAAFYAGNPNAGGIYTRATGGTGAVSTVADTSTIAPVIGGMFINFLPPSVSGGTVALVGGNFFGIGVYTGPAAGGPLTAVATTQTTMPGGTHQFRQFGGDPNSGPAPGPTISGSVVAFAGSQNPSGPSVGIYATTGPGGQLARIADTTTPVPNHPASAFTSFDPWVSLSGSAVVFVGRSGAGPGIYSNATGPLTKVVAAGDVFDGRTVADLGIGKESFDGTLVTFWAGFTDGSSGVYVAPVAPVPEPAGVLAVAAAVGIGLSSRRRRGGVRGWLGGGSARGEPPNPLLHPTVAG